MAQPKGSALAGRFDGPHHHAAEVLVAFLAKHLTRPVFFAATTTLGFANGISEKVYRSIADLGFSTAAFNTFDISIILWGAGCATLAAFLRTSDRAPIRYSDFAVAGLACLAFMAPVPAASWTGLFAVAVYLHATASDATERRATAMVFALTIPLFWARLVFAAFDEAILSVDAKMVGWLVGTEPLANVVPLANGTGSLFIEPGCSSFANLSLVVLGSWTFVTMRDSRWSLSALGWTLASAIAVVVINVTRIGLIGLYPEQYDVIHGPIGSAIAGWLTLAVVLGIGYNRIGRDAPVDR